MKFDIVPRRHGKTMRMMQWLAAAKEGEVRMLVVHSVQEADRIKKLMADWTVPKDSYDVVTLDQLKSVHGRRNVILGIDNLEIMLGHLLGFPVTRVTATGELYEDN